MKCGHSANAVDGNGKDCCVICMCFEKQENKPDLTGRKATCCYGNHGEVNSSYSLAFFEYKHKQNKDTYYCGCWGYD